MLVDFPERQAATIREYAIGVQSNSRHQIEIIQVGNLKDCDLNQYEALILHYDLFGYPFESEGQLTSFMRGQIAQFNGPKLAFAQDEYRACLQRIRTLNAMGITHLFTLAEESIWPVMYPKEFRDFELSRVLTGYYSPSELGVSSPLAGQREWLVGYRGRVTPSYLGELGDQKVRIAERVEDFARANKLPVNVSARESDRIYGEAWLEFLRNSTICVGSESGSSSIDLSQEMQHSDENRKGKSNYAYPASLESMIRMAKVTTYSAISPRLFEYTEAGALMALLPGEYSGIIRPWEHYFPLDSNLGNLEDLIAFFQNPNEAEEMILRAQKALLGESLSYRELGRQVDAILDSMPLNLIVEQAPVRVADHHQNVPETNTAPPPVVPVIPNMPVGLREFASKWITHRQTRDVLVRSARAVRKLEFLILQARQSYSSDNLERVERVRVELASHGLLIRKWRTLLHVGLRRDLFILIDDCSLALTLGFTLEIHRSGKRVWIEWRNVGSDIHQELRRFPPVTPDVFDGSSGLYISRGEFSSSKAVRLNSVTRIMGRNNFLKDDNATVLTQAVFEVLSS